MNSTELRNYLEQQKGKKFQLESSIETLNLTILSSEELLHLLEQAKEVVREVGHKIQEQLQFHISDITSLALEGVFDKPYTLEVEFVNRRGKMECDLFFIRDGMRVDPVSSAGLGAVDVASFALRVVSWTMMIPRTDNVIILDEPFKHLKGRDANLRVLQMVRTLSQKLHLQFIMISDERISREDIIENADKVFRTTIKQGISKVEEI